MPFVAPESRSLGATDPDRFSSETEHFIDRIHGFVASRLRKSKREPMNYGHVCELIRLKIDDPMALINRLPRTGRQTGTVCLFLACALGAAMEIPATAQTQPAEAAVSLNDANAHEALISWIEAYQTGEYAEQWRLTHPRRRRGRPRRLWNRVMRNAQRNDGALLSYTIGGGAEVIADQLPCSEQGHCYRPGIDYVFFTVQTEYENAAPPQPEYVAMALSGDQWVFGGGTLLNRPFGETSVIMTESDERRYRPRASDINR